MKLPFPGLAIGMLLPFHFGFGQTQEILPEEIAPGVPRTAMMTKWLKKQAIVALDRRDAAFEALKTDDDLKNWQNERRAFFRRQLGGFPERTPLNPKVTGERTIDDYRIEKLFFESQPGLHVTATLYLPLGKGPFPAVLHPTGHSASAKNRDLYQQASIVIVKGGCAVLCYDPIGQGERQQLSQPDGKPFASTVQHALIHQGMHLLGSNTARTMIWDGMRAIDYLQSRPDIIPDKIGCTGISGGGTNTSYLMALDDRIVAAAPGCYLTGFRSLLNTIGPQDAEQNIHGQIAFGMDHSDYVLMRLPKPTLIMAATGDYFDIKGAWNLFRDGKRFATRQGFPERVDLVEPDTDHGFPTGMRVGAANWMRRWLLELDQPISEGELKPLPEEELNATPNGKVLELEGARTAFELNAEWNESFAARRAENAKPENRGTLLKKVRALTGARDLADLPEPEMKKVGEGRLVIEPEPGIFLPGHHIGGKVFRYDEEKKNRNKKKNRKKEDSGGGKWTEVGQLPGLDGVNGLVTFKGRLYATGFYQPGFFRYEGGTTWTPMGSPSGPEGKGAMRTEALCVFNGSIYATGYDEGAVYRFDGEQWTRTGLLGTATRTQAYWNGTKWIPTGLDGDETGTQVYSLSVYRGKLHAGTWPEGKVYRYEGDDNWVSTGRLGEEQEIMGAAIYNGKLYAGSLPMGEIFRYDGDENWRSVGRVDFTEDVIYRRAYSMAVYRGRLFSGTFPSGWVRSFEAGKMVTYDRELPSGWRHLAAVKAGGVLKLFVDGERVAVSEGEFAAEDFDLNNEAPLRIGFGQHDFFRGKMKDVRLYGRALDSEEIAAMAAMAAARP